MAAPKKEIKSQSPLKWYEGTNVWLKKNSKVIYTIVGILIVVVAVIFFMNLNSANRNKNAAQKLSTAKVELMSRPHIVAVAIIDDPKYVVLPGIQPEAPAAYILTMLKQRDQLDVEAIDPGKTKEAEAKLGLTDESLPEPQNAASLGRELGADYILVTKNAPGKPPMSRLVRGSILGENHWQVILIDATKSQSIGQGAVWLEGTEDNPQPNSDFFLLAKPYKSHSATPAQCLAAAEQLKDITQHFADTKSAQLAYLYLGDAYYFAGSFQDALDAYKEGEIKVSDSEIRYQCQLGTADSLVALGNNDEALSNYQKLLGESGATAKALAPEVLLRMADCYQQKNDLEGQKKVLSQLMKDYPNSPWLETAQEQYRSLFY